MAKVKDRPWFPDDEMKRVTIYKSDHDVILRLIEKERRGGIGKPALTVQDAIHMAIDLIASQYD